MRSASLSDQHRGSLSIVGTGITGVGQTTLEAVECIKTADVLFYAVVEPTTELWLRQLQPTAISLADLYAPGKPRAKTYAEMTARMVSAVRRGARVCAAFYGHPGAFVDASHRAIRTLRREGYRARMFPGISADGCLYADLGINPGARGVQSFEATDFLLSRRRFDPTSGLVLWQVGVLGEPDARLKGACRPERLRFLTRVLSRAYPSRHRLVVYYAPTFPAHDAIVQRLELRGLASAVVHPMALLYVPPRRQRSPDPRVARWLVGEA